MRDSVLDFGDSVVPRTGGMVSARRLLPVRFTGSGSEYFRIWIVNLLVTLVTLGLYYPWAKVRRLRYFYGNTLVDGAPLGFHGNPRKMFRGYVLVGVLFALYSMAGNFSAAAGFVALLIVAAIAPAMLKSSMQFRLANTSWRGLRFSFEGSVGGAYRAVVPLFVPGVVLVGALGFVADPERPPLWYGAVAVAVTLVTFAVLPWLFWKLKQYQHNHYALASVQTTFKATLGSFYRLFFKSIGVALLVLVVPLALGVAFYLVNRGGAKPGVTGMVLLALAPLPVVLALLVVARSYLIARLQNLVWTKTGNRSLRFVSALRFTALFWLTLKNWLLMVLTLGLYWPFAAVAVARLRLEAVTVKTRQDPATLVTLLRAAEGEAAGDAAGDLFGLDIGL